jgi:hypothetical protein
LLKTPQGKINYMYNEMEWVIYDTNQFIACLPGNYGKVGGYTIVLE